MHKELDFFGYVFGVERPPPGETIMSKAMPRYATRLRHHEDACK